MIDYAKQNPTLAVVEEVVRELANAREFFPKPFASAHEGYAILKEEVDELYQLWKTAEAIIISPPESKPWKLHEFTASDLDGNIFRVFYDFSRDQ